MESRPCISLYIPVQLCEYVLINKLIKPFKLYVLLKSMCSGQIQLNDSVYEEIAAKLGYRTVRSVKNNLNDLLQLDYVGFNPKSKYYFIRGFEEVKKRHGIKSDTDVEFALKDILQLKEFCMAAVIGFVIRVAEAKRRELEYAKGCSNQGLRQLPQHHAAISILSKKLQCSSQSAHVWKHAARKAGFISVKSNLEATGLNCSLKSTYVKNNPDVAHLVKVRNNMLYLQRCDIIQHYLRFKVRIKNKPLERDINTNNTISIKDYRKCKGR